MHDAGVPARRRTPARIDQRRLAGAGLADQQRQALAGRDAVLQVRQRLAMTRGQQQVLRVGAELERQLVEPVEGRIHRLLRSASRPTRQRRRPGHHDKRDWRHANEQSAGDGAARRSAVVCIIGTSASTGRPSEPVTSSSVLRLLSRIYDQENQAETQAAPPSAPMPYSRCRFGLYGRAGTRAGSRILNCWPICRLSRLTESFDSSLLPSRLA